MVAPWLSWSTVLSTAAGRSERFSFFSFSWGDVCCVAACDAIAHVNSTAIVHFMNRMKSSWREYGANSTWPYLTAGLQAIVSGINGDVARARRIRRSVPSLSTTEESYEQTVTPGLCTVCRRCPRVAWRELGTRIQGREVQHRRRRRHRLSDRRAGHGTRVRLAQHARDGGRRRHRQSDRRHPRH